jgi:hypothetical protein
LRSGTIFSVWLRLRSLIITLEFSIGVLRGSNALPSNQKRDACHTSLFEFSWVRSSPLPALSGMCLPTGERGRVERRSATHRSCAGSMPRCMRARSGRDGDYSPEPAMASTATAISWKVATRPASPT